MIDEALFDELEKHKERFPDGSIERIAFEKALLNGRRWLELRSKPPSKENDAAMRDALAEFQKGAALWSEAGFNSTEVSKVLDDALKDE